MTQEDALAAAKNDCARLGLAWNEPVRVSEEEEWFEIATGVQTRPVLPGSYPFTHWFRVYKQTGKVVLKAYKPWAHAGRHNSA